MPPWIQEILVINLHWPLELKWFYSIWYQKLVLIVYVKYLNTGNENRTSFHKHEQFIIKSVMHVQDTNKYLYILYVHI